MNTPEILAGFVVGGIVGLTGVGGGALMTPLLILLFGVHPSGAIGTDLLFAAATKSVGAAVHGLGHTVDWRLVWRLASGSLPGAGLALACLGSLGVHGALANHISALILGVVLILAATALLIRPWLIKTIRHDHTVTNAPPIAPRTGLTIGLGFVLGILVSITSVGSGALGTVALMLLYPRMPAARVVGSDLAHAVPLTLLAGIGHWMLGTVSLSLLLPLLLGSIPGIILGSIAASRTPETLLRIGLAGMLAASGWFILAA
ncbi:sulfite exporter TauE/SafE family protein [Acidiphilium sp. PA]|uniref:sulfite exporter TauE/SafE family protein n=1 Tax=Acidiphilium sp. PA TaxID=2871705 RepID=UPI0022447D38|nr:sulfite exporter TauE/SafE family protein [Acidiphilium sp. PA]MCW8307886.1 sulfite exporter TauE/SafE family protein [Acidiphilium sp. PA]